MVIILLLFIDTHRSYSGLNLEKIDKNRKNSQKRRIFVAP